MTVVLLESSMERVSKVVRSRIKSVLERKGRNPSMEQSLNQHDSPSRKVFELFFARPARRTVSFLRPGQQKTAAVEIQDNTDKRLTQASFLQSNATY